MESERSGVYRVLRLSVVYDLVQRIFGAEDGLRQYVSTHIRPFAGARILDIGAGTGSIAKFLGAVDYLGIEPNPTYVADFNKREGTATKRLISGVTQTVRVADDAFDIVVISAVLHHVSDEIAQSILAYAHKALRPGGRVVLLDPVLHNGQGRLSRFFVSRDRGKHVRQETAYKALFTGSNLDVSFTIRTDLNRLPYSHILATGTKI